MKKRKALLPTVVIDIETSPNLSYTWGKYEQDVVAFERESVILSWSAKYLGEKKAITRGLCDYPGYKRDKFNDKALLVDLKKILDHAEVVIWHNGDNFDARKINTRLAFHKIKPPSPYRSIDTLKVMRNRFKLNSNKLADAGPYFGIGYKLETGGFNTWRGCMAGNKKAWATMKKYNEQDVLLLEELYWHLRDWIKNHPEDKLWTKQAGCPYCGSHDCQSRGLKPRKLLGGDVNEYYCKKCKQRSYSAVINKWLD